jgi:hypothetical protein
MNPAILPVRWLAFTATKTYNNEALLSWKVANEVNNKLYSVERSQDGRNFNEITVISAVPGSNEKTYHYTDYMPGEGIVYYRIKQVDKDGRFSYSGIQKITFINKRNVAVSRVKQNPANDFIAIEFSSPLKKVSLNVYDAAGKKVRQTATVSIAQNETVNIPVNQLAKGMYTLSVRNQTINETHKVIVQ